MNKSAATDAIRQQLKEVALEVKQLGGWSGFKSGEWLFQLMEKTFRHYSQGAAKESFPLEFPGRTRADSVRLFDLRENRFHLFPAEGAHGLALDVAQRADL